MNKIITIKALNQEEALKKVSESYSIPISSLRCFKIREYSDGISFRVMFSTSELKSEDSDYLLEKLDEELLSIETDEIIEGLTEDELDEKGFISEKTIIIEKKNKLLKRKEKDYLFMEGIDYYANSIYKLLDDIPYEDLENLSDTIPNTIIAVEKSKVMYAKKEDFNPESIHSKEYLETSNIIITYNKGEITYISKIKGKTVLVNNRIYMIPSDVDGHHILEISPDNMSVKIDIFPSKGCGKAVTTEDIFDSLSDKNVVFGIKNRIIAESIDIAIKTGSVQRDVVVAEGRSPVAGIDAKINLKFSLEQEYEDFRILPDGKIDYRKKAIIKIVLEGDTLASIEPSKPGKDGKTVLGNSLPAKEGDSKVLYAGSNVKISDNATTFFATCSGQPVLNKNILHVFEHYVVSGDVDYSSGNIDFDGNVTIKGNVLSGFEVKATGDILVMKNVDAGIIDAGRDIIILGGIIGNNESIVQCGRNLNVRHLQNAIVEAEGDVIIKDSAVHSEIYTTGNVMIEQGKGTIMGGIAYALRSFYALSIGSKSGSRTEIIVGHNFLVKKKIAEFNRAQIFCKNNIKKIEKYLKPLLELTKSEKTITDEKKQKLALVVKKHKELTEHYTIMEAKIKEMENAYGSTEKVRVKVRDTIFPNVKMVISNNTFLTREEITHASFYVGLKKEVIVKGPY